VAGTFYPGDAGRLRRDLERLAPPGPRRKALATLAPHAGYAYSGAVAGAVYGSVEIPRDVVLVSFSHRGRGAPVAVWPEGPWETPIGEAPVAGELCRELLLLRGVTDDRAAFEGEHSGEVQLPFLLHLRPDVRIAPLSVQTHDPAALRALGEALAALLAARDALLAATTDLTHCGEGYGVAPPPGRTPAQFAREQDARVLARIAALDFDGFFDVVERHDVTMCGVAPTALMIAYARARRAAAAEVVKYATSADDEPGADRAVGYPGVVVPSP
jgi:AmmeMemoRadiSam system protein B